MSAGSWVSADIHDTRRPSPVDLGAMAGPPSRTAVPRGRNFFPKQPPQPVEMPRLQKEFTKQNQLFLQGQGGNAKAANTLKKAQSWEPLFSAFERLDSHDKRFEFCSALCARDLGLELKRHCKIIWMGSQEGGEQASQEGVTEGRTALRSAKDVDDLLDRFVRDTISPML